jgi:tetratricopeptide (TPR) repeat protein
MVMNALVAITLLLCAPVGSESAVNQWLQSAEGSAVRVRTAWEEFQCWPLIGRVYSRRGDVNRAVAAITHISKDKLRWNALGSLAQEAADRGAFEEARSILNHAADHRLRTGYLQLVADIASLQHNFAVAEQFCTVLDDADLRQEAWYGLAAEEALACQYDLALRTAQRVGERGEWSRERLLEFIESCRRRSGCRQPKPFIADLADEVFSIGGREWTPRTDDISIHDRLMNDRSDPIQRAVSSTLVARWCLRHNQAARCRFAIATAAESLSLIRNDYQRVACCADLAETMLDAGLSVEAKGVVDAEASRDTVAAVLKEPAVKEPDVCALPPKLVFVLIRLGKIADAFEVATSASGLLLGRDTWWAAGVGCALEGKTGEVARRLPTMDRDRDKAILAAGVALGLQELAEKERHKARR